MNALHRHRRIALLLVALIGILVAIYFEPTHCVRGWLWGEAFFDGRPTSYWRRELARWDFDDIDWMPGRKWYYRRPSLIEYGWARWLPPPTPLKINWHSLLAGPDLQLLRDPDALPVLVELRDDVDPKIRHFAQLGIERHRQQ